MLDSQQAPFPEPPPGYVLPEPGFPNSDPAQVGALAEGRKVTLHLGQAGSPAGADSLTVAPLLASALSAPGEGTGAAGSGASLSGLCSRPGLQPPPASRPGCARERPALCASQPAHRPVHTAGEPSPGGLRGGPKPSPSAHRPGHSLRAGWPCCCDHQLRGEDSRSPASHREGQE